MGLAYKDSTRFHVPGESPAVLEVTVSAVDGQWEAVVRVQDGGQAGIPLGRRFRARAKEEALGKMIRWVRGRFPEAIPIAERRVCACEGDEAGLSARHGGGAESDLGERPGDPSCRDHHHSGWSPET